MTFAVFDLIKGGLEGSGLGSTLILGIIFFAVAALLMMRAHIPAFMIFLVTLPIAKGLSESAGILPGFVWSGMVVVLAVIAGITFISIFNK